MLTHERPAPARHPAEIEKQAQSDRISPEEYIRRLFQLRGFPHEFGVIAVNDLRSPKISQVGAFQTPEEALEYAWHESERAQKWSDEFDPPPTKYFAYAKTGQLIEDQGSA